MATTGVCGFHLVPPAWIGDTLPAPAEEITLATLQSEVCRTQLISGIKIRVLHCGVFIFDFTEWDGHRDFPTQPTNFQELDEAHTVVRPRVRLMNAFLACLYTCLHRGQQQPHAKMVVSPVDLAYYEQFEAPETGLDDLYVLGLTRVTRAGIFTLEFPSAFRHSFQLNISEKTVMESSNLLDELIGKEDPDALLLPEMLLRSRKAYEDLDYNLALILSWTMTETMIMVLWDRYIQNNRTRIIGGNEIPFVTANRKNILTDSRNFSASVTTETLSLLDELPLDLYQLSVDVRRSRNQWMHELQPVTREQAEAAIQLAAEMLKYVKDIDLPARMRVVMSLG